MPPRSSPTHDFLGLEVYVPGVAQTLVTMLHERVTNIRMAVVNAPEALTTMLPADPCASCASGSPTRGTSHATTSAG